MEPKRLCCVGGLVCSGEFRIRVLSVVVTYPMQGSSRFSFHNCDRRFCGNGVRSRRPGFGPVAKFGTRSSGISLNSPWSLLWPVTLGEAGEHPGAEWRGPPFGPGPHRCAESRRIPVATELRSRCESYPRLSTQ